VLFAESWFLADQAATTGNPIMHASHSQFPPKALRRTASSGGSKGLFEASGALTILDARFADRQLFSPLRWLAGPQKSAWPAVLSDALDPAGWSRHGALMLDGCGRIPRYALFSIEPAC